MDSPSALLQFLRQGEWFGGLPPPLQNLIVSRGALLKHARGEYIIREGMPAKGLFAVLAGRIHVVHHVDEQNVALIHVGEAGNWFGDYGLLTAERSVNSIVADVATRTLFLSIPEFERIVAAEPRYYRAFARLALERYGLLLQYLGKAQALRPEEWLRTRLLDLAAMHRRDRPSSGPVTIGIAQADLASMVGVSRQTLSALLARLEARGLIEVGFRRIRVLG